LGTGVRQWHDGGCGRITALHKFSRLSRDLYGCNAVLCRSAVITQRLCLQQLVSVQRRDAVFNGFKQFMLRGNVLDLAVAVVIGAAFGEVIAALVKDLLTPFIAAAVGKPDFSAIAFTVNGSRFPIGDFINAVVAFVLVGAALNFFVVAPV